MSYTFIIAILQNYFLIHLPIQTFLLSIHDSLSLPSSIICTFLSYHTTCSYILLCHHLSPSPILPSLLYSYTILCNIKSYYPLCYPSYYPFIQPSILSYIPPSIILSNPSYNFFWTISSHILPYNPLTLTPT